MRNYTINLTGLTYEQRLPLLTYLTMIKESVLHNSAVLRPDYVCTTSVLKYDQQGKVWWLSAFFPNTDIVLSITEFIQKTTPHTFKEL